MTTPRTIPVLLFAIFRETEGRDHIDIPWRKGLTLQEIRRYLITRWPDQELLLGRSLLAINHDYAPDDQIVECDDEVAVIPPVSGG